MPSRIFIVEDNPLMRRMLNDFLTRQPDLQVCGTAETGEEALERLTNPETDLKSMHLILVDTSLPGISGITLVEKLQSLHSDLPCLMYSGHGESYYVEQALAAGARGYLLKGNPFELPDAIEKVLNGETYVGKTLQ